MVDIWSKRKRSEVMSKVRSRGNKNTELRLVALFRMNRITGWRRCLPLIGKPDFTFRKARLVVFVDGCYWHGCTKHCRMPESNIAFWRLKISRNRTRDRLVTRTLRKEGWLVLRVWEHELRKPAGVLARIRKALVPV